MKRAMTEAEEEEEAINGDSKRGRTESDVEDFFALLERIRQIEKELGVGKKSRCPEEPAAVISKPAWHLSFEWEDFSGSCNADQKERFGLANGYRNNHVCQKWQPLSVDQKKGNKEMLDLNLPSNLF